MNVQDHNRALTLRIKSNMDPPKLSVVNETQVIIKMHVIQHEYDNNLNNLWVALYTFTVNASKGAVSDFGES